MLSGPKSGAMSASGARSASGAVSGPALGLAPGQTPRNRLTYAGWIAAAVFAAAVLGLLIARTKPSTTPPAALLSLHALILPPEGMYLTDTLALSPDGRRLAFVAAEPTGRKHLWVRALDARTPQSIANTDGASEPFWSPDGQQLAFFANGRLNRVAATGGAVTTICQTGTTAGGSWNREDVIVFAQQDGPMMRVAASGGRPEPLTTFDRNLGETHHLYPAFLPDGRHYTYYVNSRERGVYVGELGSTTHARLFDPDPALPPAAAVTPAVYAPTGHLLYVRDRVLMARRFDPGSLAVSGEPTTLVQTVDYDPPGQAAFTVAEGIVVYRASQHRPVADLESPPGAFRTLALSPDGRTVAVDRRDAQGLPSVWLVDSARGTSSRLTATYWSGDPLWSSDGRTLAYSVAADSPPNLVIRGDRGQGTERRLLQQPSEIQYATSFTPDGRQIVYSALTATTGSDIYAVSTTDDHPTPQRLLQTSANEGQGRVSPDGRWLVYMSDESGQAEIYASRFPEMQGKVALSTGGGSRPFWRADGREVFYLRDGRVIGLPIAPSAAGLSPGKPEELFKVTLYGDVYAPDASGKRFLIARPAATTEVVPLEILLNPLR
jgi:Tol biopolymer transport system component